MTVFIASLFLPYTVNFHLDQARNRSARSSPKSAPLQESSPQVPQPASAALSLFENRGNVVANPGLTPGATTEDERIFLANAEKEPSAYPFPKDANDLHSLRESEAHSPKWGATTTFVQPKAQPPPPPSPSILKHQASEAASQPPQKAKKQSSGIEALKEEERANRPGQGRSMSFSKADWTVEPAEQGNGGLRNAVRSATEAGFLGEKIWVGTLGMPTDALKEHVKAGIAEKMEDEHESLTVFVKDGDFDGHYTHFCKTILWPVFHYQIPDNPKSKAYEDHSWIYYVKVNQAFAERIAKNWRKGDSIWVHDYHLLLLPAMLRKLLPDAKIGFFLHIAFPSSEVFRCLAPRKELLEGILGADLVGFQTDEYCRHFLQTCSRILCVEATNDGVQLEDRFVDVGTFPIGIDPTSWDERRKADDVQKWIKTIRERYGNKRLIVGRDKLDNIRGVRQKLLSYELFLNTYPEWRDKVVLVQVATTTTEQPELEATLSDIAMRINSTHSTLAHQPLVFLKQDLAFAQYLALISMADALMVTSLREGMNLTSHEFIYCQDGHHNSKAYGSLILSEFTGSAALFDGHALLVNPWDYRQCSEAIHTALTIGEEEKKKVWTALHEAVIQNSTGNWVKSFSDTLSKAWDEHSSRETIAVPRLSVSKLEEHYKQSNRRLIIVDYEGTLASWGSPKSIILTTPQRAITTLTDLTEDSKNVVYVMSSRMPEEMERLFNRVSGLGLIAENGCFLREPNTDAWIRLTDANRVRAWKAGVSSILDYFHARTEGSWIEERHCSLVFHYGSADDQASAARQASECADHINDACESQHVHAVPVDGALVVETVETNKASAAEMIWRYCLERGKRDGQDYRPDFLLVIGDSREDEVVFRWANKLAGAKAIPHVMTVTLGSRSTEAMATLTQGVTGVLSCLQRLAASG
ncbi:CAZyme family GT20 [Paecilomyces variotii]|nr:CAZyme family GT20 [Paecilomyces variotii]KAJ9320064.1 CAZyme family GT20 [Paecilomyces variotii]KAJ9330168.1 CAZyme family GT20 [Paecilomyces variotii]